MVHTTALNMLSTINQGDYASCDPRDMTMTMMATGDNNNAVNGDDMMGNEVGDDGDGAMGDDNNNDNDDGNDDDNDGDDNDDRDGDSAMGSNVTGYNDDDDGDGR